MVRAARPRGEIVKIDTAQAEALPGVKAVWTTESRNVRFAGQDVAAVAATSPELAEDAARLIEVTYDERPYVDRPAEGDGGRTRPLVYEPRELPAEPTRRRPKRRRARATWSGPTCPGAAARAATWRRASPRPTSTVEATYYVPVHTHAPLETHGVIAKWEGDQLTIWASTQGIFTVRDGVADALEHRPQERARDHRAHGRRASAASWRPPPPAARSRSIACKLAKQAGAPVKLMLDRHEEHLCTGNAPSALDDGAARREAGRHADGAAPPLVRLGRASPAARAPAGPPADLYANCPNVRSRSTTSSRTPARPAPLRAPGHPQGAFALESAMDELAEKLGMDPLELRRKNEPSPVRRCSTSMGAKAIGWERRNTKAGEAHRSAQARDRDGERQLVRDRARPRRGRRGARPPRRQRRAVLGRPGHRHRLPHRDGDGGGRGAGPAPARHHAAAWATPAGRRARLRRQQHHQHAWRRWCGWPRTTRATSSSRWPRRSCGAKPEELDAADGKIFVAAQPGKRSPSSRPRRRCRARSSRAWPSARSSSRPTGADLAGTQFAEVEVDIETGEVRVVKIVSVQRLRHPDQHAHHREPDHRRR